MVEEAKAIGHIVPVSIEIADERVRFQKVQLRRWGGQFQQGAQIAQPHAP